MFSGAGVVSPLVGGRKCRKAAGGAPAAWWWSCGSWSLRRGHSKPPGLGLVVNGGDTEVIRYRPHRRPRTRCRHGAGKGRPGARDADGGCLLALRRVARHGPDPHCEPALAAAKRQIRVHGRAIRSSHLGSPGHDRDRGDSRPATAHTTCSSASGPTAGSSGRSATSRCGARSSSTRRWARAHRDETCGPTTSCSSTRRASRPPPWRSSSCGSSAGWASTISSPTTSTDGAAARSAARIRHVLTHTGGFPDASSKIFDADVTYDDEIAHIAARARRVGARDCRGVPPGQRLEDPRRDRRSRRRTPHRPVPARPGVCTRRHDRRPSRHPDRRAAGARRSHRPRALGRAHDAGDRERRLVQHGRVPRRPDPQRAMARRQGRTRSGNARAGASARLVLRVAARVPRPDPRLPHGRGDGLGPSVRREGPSLPSQHPVGARRPGRVHGRARAGARSGTAAWRRRAGSPTPSSVS